MAIKIILTEETVPSYVLNTENTRLEVVGISINLLPNRTRCKLVNIPCRPSEATVQKLCLVRCCPHSIVAREVLCKKQKSQRGESKGLIIH